MVNSILDLEKQFNNRKSKIIKIGRRTRKRDSTK